MQCLKKYVQASRRAKYGNYRPLDDHWVILSTSKTYKIKFLLWRSTLILKTSILKTISSRYSSFYLTIFSWFCRKSLPVDSRHSDGYELCLSSRRHLSVLIRSGINTVFALNGKETVSISVQSNLHVLRWCIVHKQPRIRKLSGPDVSCWAWDQGHYREHHFRFLPKFTTVDWDEWSTSHFYLWQTKWFQVPHHKLSVPE